MRSFKICANKGFHITFPNGVTLSTQIGPANYCDNYDAEIGDPTGKHKEGYQSWEAEVAAWYDQDGKSKWIADEYKKDCGGVLGYLDINEWLKFFDWCRNYAIPAPVESARSGGGE